jgi:hypothetical protein
VEMQLVNQLHDNNTIELRDLSYGLRLSELWAPSLNRLSMLMLNFVLISKQWKREDKTNRTMNGLLHALDIHHINIYQTAVTQSYLIAKKRQTTGRYCLTRTSNCKACP